MSYEDIKKELAAGKSYILRLKSPGRENNYIKHTDVIKGTIELPENYNDIVLLKSDGIPTYHFAHVVDDHFMRTTHVVRGEEWLSTLPWHLQMFDMLGWKRPQYIHTAHLLKSENGGKRKLSKRKDPELGLQYYKENGYPEKAVKEYLMTLLNSNFEEWRIANKDKPMEDFVFSVKKLSTSGALVDMDKLRDITKNTVSLMSAEQVYSELIKWTEKYDRVFHNLLTENPKYALDILSIGRGGKKPRNELCMWSEVKDYMGFFYDRLFVHQYVFTDNLDKNEIKEVLTRYTDIYSDSDSQDEWFEKIKDLSESLGFARETKEYKINPDNFKGHSGDIAMILRIAVSGKQSSPDTYQVMKILGSQRVIKRLKQACESI